MYSRSCRSYKTDHCPLIHASKCTTHTYWYLSSVIFDGAVEPWGGHAFPHRVLIAARGRDALYRDGVCDVGRFDNIESVVQIEATRHLPRT